MKKRLLAVVLALVMVLGMVPAAMAEGSTPVEVGTYDDLVTALGEGKDVKLTADIIAPDKAVLTISNQILDLGDKKLTLNGESGKLENGTIRNGIIEITTYEGDTVADGMFDVYGPATVSGVTFHSDGSAIYAIFDIKSDALTMTDCTIDMANNDPDGGLLYFNGGNTLTMTDCTVTGTDIGDFISNGTVEMTDCTVTLKGTKDGALDNGINGAALTLNNTSVTIDGATGRGITTDGDAIAINGTSNVTLTNCAEGGIRYKASATITVADTASLSGTVKVDSAATDAKVNNTTVGVTGEKLPTVTVSGGTTAVNEYVYPVYVGTQGYDTLQEALDAAKGETNIVIDLQADATLDITAWQTLAIGGSTTETITINGKGHTLTFNQKDSDWNNVATNNDAKLILNDMTIANSGYNDGPWNRYDINFACDVELNNVVATKALAFKADATLNDVVIKETGDNYAIWIQANGQAVSIDGLTVNSDGRGIKIDEQYVDNAAEVTLSVKDATFTTAKKAAIVVKSAAGADITATNVNIENVAADKENLVWIDEDGAAAFGNVTVEGGTVAQEGEASFVASVGSDDAISGYYKTLQAAINAATEGQTVTLLASYEDYKGINVSGKLTIDLNGYNIYRTFGGNALSVTPTGDLTVVGEGTISGSAYGILVNSGKLTLNGGTVEGRDGEGIQNKGTTIVDGASVTGTTIGVDCYAGSILEIKSGSVSGGEYGATLGGDNTTINVTGGTLIGETGISSNAAYSGTAVNISGGTVEGGVLGIYHPQQGDLNISGGTVTGLTGIAMKSGHLNVTGGTVEGTGEKADYIFTAGGFTSTGDAIVIESVQSTTDAYEAPTASITGGTFTSDNASAVSSQVADASVDTPVINFISNGTFSSDPSDYCVAGSTGTSIGNGKWGVVVADATEVAAKATVTIKVTPADATVEIKQGDDVIARGNAGDYTLLGGTYTYTVSKPGYDTKTGTFTVDKVNQEIEVTLSETYYAPTYRVTVEKADNGAVKSSATYATQGQRVTITVTPDDGYLLDTLTVMDAKGNEIELTDKGDGKYTFKMPGRKVTVTAVCVYDLPYTDVDVEDEFYDAVCFLHQQGLINGMGNNLYQPETSFNRAMIATMLHRLAGLPEYEQASDLTDVADGVWYTDAIHWGTEAGLITGYPDGSFDPGKDISVRELVVFLYRYAQYAEDPDCDKSDWTGATWADAGLAWAEANDLLPAGEDLNAPASRALAAQVIYNVYNLLNK